MYCPFCGVEIPNESAFCGFCGKKIPTNESAAVSESVVTTDTAVVETVDEPSAETAVSAVSKTVSEHVETEAAAVSETVPEHVETEAAAVSETVPEHVETEVVAVSEMVPEHIESAAAAVSEKVPEHIESAAAAVSEKVPEHVETEAAAVSETVPEHIENAAVAVSATVSEPVASTSVSETANDIKPEYGIGSGSVTYGQPDDAAFGELPEGKDIKARRAFNITALLKNRLFLICAGAVLVFIALIIIAINSMTSGSNKNPLKGFYYSVTADDETVFFYNGERIRGTDFSAGRSISAISDDGVTALVVDNSTLTLLSKGKATEITDELASGTVVLSANGQTVLYVSDGDLMSYSGGKNTRISELENPSFASYVVSPDGGTVVFADYGDDYSIKSANAWKSGNLIDLDAKFRPIAVSNGGKMVYGIKNYDLIYIKNLKEGSDEKIRKFGGLIDSTADNSGLIFSSDTGTYYFDASTSEAIKITSRSISVLDEGGYPTPRKNFKNFYAVSESGVYKFTGKKNDFESDKIISGASRVRLSSDGKTFVYKDDDELIRVSSSNPDKENVIADDVYSYGCDPSLKHIYYLDEDGDLRYASSKKTKICSDVRLYAVNFDGVCVFSDDDGDLYYSSKGGERKKVSGISDVEQITMINGIIYVRADDSLYVTTNGKKFDKTGVNF